MEDLAVSQEDCCADATAARATAESGAANFIFPECGDAAKQEITLSE